MIGKSKSKTPSEILATYVSPEAKFNLQEIEAGYFSPHETDLKNADDALSKSTIGLVARIFNKATAGPKFNDYKNEVDELIENSSGDSFLQGMQFLINMTKHGDKPLYDDKGDLQPWVYSFSEKEGEEPVEFPEQRRKEFAALIKKLFLQMNDIISDEQGRFRPWLREFIGDEKLVELLKKFDVEEIRIQLISGAFFPLSMEKIQEQRGNPALIFNTMINYQTKFNLTIRTQIKKFKKNFQENPDYKNSEAIQALDGMLDQQAKEMLKDPCRDYTKFSPLMKLASLINELPSDTELYRTAFAALQNEINKVKLSPENIQEVNQNVEVLLKMISQIKLLKSEPDNAKYLADLTDSIVKMSQQQDFHVEFLEAAVNLVADVLRNKMQAARTRSIEEGSSIAQYEQAELSDQLKKLAAIQGEISGIKEIESDGQKRIPDDVAPLIRKIAQLFKTTKVTQPVMEALHPLDDAVKLLTDKVMALDDSEPYHKEANQYLKIQLAAVNQVSDGKDPERARQLIESLTQTTQVIDRLKNLKKAIHEGSKLRGEGDVYVATSRLVYDGVCDDAKKLFSNPKLDPTHKEKKLLIKTLSVTALGARDPSDPQFATGIGELVNDSDVQGQPKKGKKWKGALLMMAGFLTIAVGAGVAIATFGAGSPLGAAIAGYGGLLVGTGVALMGADTYSAGVKKGLARDLGIFHEETKPHEVGAAATSEKKPPQKPR